MQRPLYLFLLVPGVLSPGGCGGSASERPDFTIAAAASLTTVMEEALGRWNATHAAQGRGNYAASSTLARQIERGAPFDLYVSANPRWMERLVELGHVDPKTRRDLARNELLLVAPAQGVSPALELPEHGAAPAALAGRRWTTGDPEHVPLGLYTRESLETLGWWDSVAPRLIGSGDARAALRLVERGEVDWGVVYGSDAERSAEVRVLATLPADSHSAIVYPLALAAQASDGAKAFSSWLSGAQGRALFESHGFLPMELELTDR
jgi:molybdate transport system substrate-binding protein